MYIELSARNPLGKLPSLEITDLKNTPCILIMNSSGQKEELVSPFYNPSISNSTINLPSFRSFKR